MTDTTTTPTPVELGLQLPRLFGREFVYDGDADDILKPKGLDIEFMNEMFNETFRKALKTKFNEKELIGENKLQDIKFTDETKQLLFIFRGLPPITLFALGYKQPTAGAAADAATEETRGADAPAAGATDAASSGAGTGAGAAAADTTAATPPADTDEYKPIYDFWEALINFDGTTFDVERNVNDDLIAAFGKAYSAAAPAAPP